MPPPPVRGPGHGQGAKIQGKAMTGTGAQIRILGMLANRLIPKPRGSGTRAPRLIWWPEHIRIFQRFLAANQHSPDSLRALSAGNSGSTEDSCMRELAEELGIRTRQLQHAQWLGIKDKMLSSLQYRLTQLIREGLVEESWDVRNDRPAWTWDSQITREIIAADWTGHVGKSAMTGDEDEDDEDEDPTSRHMDNEASGYSVQHDEEDIPSLMSDIGMNDGLQYESYVQGDMARSEDGQNPHSSNNDDDMNNDMNSDDESTLPLTPVPQSPDRAYETGSAPPSPPEHAITTPSSLPLRQQHGSSYRKDKQPNGLHSPRHQILEKPLKSLHLHAYLHQHEQPPPSPSSAVRASPSSSPSSKRATGLSGSLWSRPYSPPGDTVETQILPSKPSTFEPSHEAHESPHLSSQERPPKLSGDVDLHSTPPSTRSQDQGSSPRRDLLVHVEGLRETGKRQQQQQQQQQQTWEKQPQYEVPQGSNSEPDHVQHTSTFIGVGSSTDTARDAVHRITRKIGISGALRMYPTPYPGVLYRQRDARPSELLPEISRHDGSPLHSPSNDPAGSNARTAALTLPPLTPTPPPAPCPSPYHAGDVKGSGASFQCSAQLSAASPETSPYEALHQLIDCRFDEIDCRIRSVIVPFALRKQKPEPPSVSSIEQGDQLAVAAARRTAQAAKLVLSLPTGRRRMFYPGGLPDEEELDETTIRNSINGDNTKFLSVFGRILLKRRKLLGETVPPW